MIMVHDFPVPKGGWGKMGHFEIASRDAIANCGEETKERAL
jgi:hypothetical protein